MRVLLTGGAGFIGSHLSERLIKAGHDIICMDNLITGCESNIDHLKGNPSFEFVDHDVSNYIEVDGDVDAVLHLASLASPVDYLNYPIKTLKVGSLGTHNTLGVAKAKGAKYLLASTSEVYGDPLVNPQPETYWGNVNPIGPRGVYDESKRFAEALVLAYNRSHGIDTKIARIFNTYGERMRSHDGRVVPNFIDQIIGGESLTVYGDGSQTRSFCYVSDLIDGLMLLLESNVNEPVNLGNPAETSIMEFAKAVMGIAGKESEIVFEELPVDDPKVRRPDITKAKELLGWEPKVNLDEGLARTIKWFRNKQ
ncbi:MAG: SDR family oxidoreductase [Candidatus Omnitrophica bacterium]|nr:SDR family oxidoreductase [Candidatus Omnitrophota bacterium]